MTEPGGADWGLALALSGRIVVVAGGLPLVVDGRVIGAVGVSGAAPSVDRLCAEDAIKKRAGFSPDRFCRAVAKLTSTLRPSWKKTSVRTKQQLFRP